MLSYAQLRAGGLSKSAIGRASGERLHRVFIGVYALGFPPTTDRARLMAATLACGDGAVVSHRSAAGLLGLLDRGPASIDVLAPRRRGEKIDGIHRHMAPLRPEETGTFDGIPCTSPARTIVDCAGTVGTRTLRSMFERAAARKMLDLAAIEQSMRPGRHGTPALRGLVEQWRPAAPLAERARLKSPLEAALLPLLARGGLPMPRCNAPVRLASGSSIEVDCLWPESKFVVEMDSRAFHDGPAAVERDRRRDRELLIVGHRCLRVSWAQLRDEPDSILAAIAAGLT